jgi:enamine deaminase RidA (YjgF/YER057c/UK114 family)
LRAVSPKILARAAASDTPLEISAALGPYGAGQSLISYLVPEGPQRKDGCRQTKEIMMTIQRFENGPRMSRVVVHNDTVYLAGLTADATVGQSVAEQTKEILGKIDGLLKQGGTDKSKLLQATIWLQDIRVVDEFNKVWDAWVVAGQTPARACIEARLQSPAKMIEIQVTAAR